MDTKLIRAIQFATLAHKDQLRKYSNIPYILHPLDVMNKLVEFGINSNKMLIAAVLHDVVEDTERTLTDIEMEFGVEIALLVEELTNTSKLVPNTNRAQRKKLDIERFKNVSLLANIIKMCDIMCNVNDISIEDKKFAKVYIAEKIEFVEQAMDKLKELEHGCYHELLLKFLDKKMIEVHLEK